MERQAHTCKEESFIYVCVMYVCVFIEDKNKNKHNLDVI